MMHLRKVAASKDGWRIYAACLPVEKDCRFDEAECPLLIFFKEDSLRGDKDRMLKRLEAIAIAEKGPYYLPNISHKIQDEIRQTDRGRVRVLWFFEENKTIVCTHGFIKKTQKTPEREKLIAVTAYAAYQDAKATGSLKWEVKKNEL